ncbi:hypothetical protein K402DRAFT_401600 [Aulographum hederae CBS 113979]|uniref:Uncharacterized protein n=1 Tax=Aulographum hederae CBS 113979 TaxID=1176131 RepID=A0A6G1HB11_9PEZI|nr:hypothetical protein K402DRAFT_401600 [Aulographum hederae CBS 113979]
MVEYGITKHALSPEEAVNGTRERAEILRGVIRERFASADFICIFTFRGSFDSGEDSLNSYHPGVDNSDAYFVEVVLSSWSELLKANTRRDKSGKFKWVTMLLKPKKGRPDRSPYWALDHLAHAIQNMKGIKINLNELDEGQFPYWGDINGHPLRVESKALNLSNGAFDVLMLRDGFDML